MEEMSEAEAKSEATGEATRRASAQQQRAGRDLAREVVSRLDGEGARYVAVRLQEACHGQVLALQRVLEALEHLGAKFPAGFKP